MTDIFKILQRKRVLKRFPSQDCPIVILSLVITAAEHRSRHKMMSSLRLGEYVEWLCVFLVGVW